MPAKKKQSQVVDVESSPSLPRYEEEASHLVPEHNGRHNGPLLNWEDVPAWLQYNRFVRTGYRHFMDRADALRSIFRWHNETMNIWTHFLPLFLFLGMLMEEVVRKHTSGEPHRVLYLFAAAGCVFVCAVSTAYHSLMCSCRNAGEYQRLICIDILGSVVVISATAVPLLLFGNPCVSNFTRTWMLTLFGASTIATVYAIFQKSMSAGQRFLLFGGHLLLRLALQFSTLMPKYRATGFHGSMSLHGESFVWLMAGGIVNVSRFPERFFTSVDPLTMKSDRDTKTNARSLRQVIATTLDFVGNSHNIWHVLSIYSCYLTFCGVHADYEEFHALDSQAMLDLCGNGKWR